MTRKVGYGSTPEHSRWQKGQSGNPRGRPKGKANFVTDLTAELAETIQITEGGKSRSITKQRALLKSLTAKGIKGDIRAAQLMMNWARAVVEDSGAERTVPPLSVEDRKILEDYLKRTRVPGEEQA